jgi:large subunit ribosomal protein LP2
MRYVAAALLAALGEKSIDAKTIKSILGSVGIEAEGDKIDLVVKELAGKNLEELIAEGQTKLASMPAGGGAAAPAAGGAAAPAAEAAKVEEKEEEKEESDDDMGFGLFD